MALFSKSKGEPPTSPPRCDRCHERRAVVHLHRVAPPASASDAATEVWLCSECATESRRGAEMN